MIVSRVILALLLWPVSFAAVAQEMCENAPPNEPIGIDLGHHLVIASYANSADNFTLLGAINHQDYQRQILELSMNHFRQSGLAGPEPNSRGSTPLALMRSAVWQLFEVIDARFAVSSTSYVVWTRGSIRSIYDDVSGTIPTRIKRWIKSTLISCGLLRKKLSISDITETFAEVLTELKTAAFEAHSVNVTWAVVGVPDFFNDTLKHAVVQAGQQAGIVILEGAVPPRSFCTHYLNPAVEEDARVLVIHQGQFHCGAQLYDGPQTRHRRQSGYPYLPLTPWASERIQRRLVDELVSGDAHFRTLIKQGGDRGFLTRAVQKTRLTLIGYDPAVEMLLGVEEPLRNGAGGNEYDDEEEKTLDELPLNLDSWWAHGNFPDMVLTRNQVTAVEDEYVESLAGSIHAYLQATRESRKKTSATKTERVDYAIVLTDHFDGELVRHAIREVVGDVVPILGSLKEMTMAADGAARLAWKRRENLLLRQDSARARHDEL
ncbi:hypothetical protein ASPACDRAFT_22413 [Aspergillus aculeatus ATCC 16872]|uniref:Uncharacterized protein n=1 Tax=Aspergillus aculeatus (strain ATCC 16872 / CBS 172.66 / WB 5094) TaxID=690307 RepID=A0A1L9X580_ASPA1|nr:uncharacterized protein ASPACDRAFT_22413 [Aspergillus aculeatus ATCC 16872]OJK03600.1 hypothetical protein ASPACDRAFT_22413 [Aspergillus aculeatus ATCC 16872]